MTATSYHRSQPYTNHNQNSIPSAAPLDFPVTTKNTRRLVNDVETQVVLSKFTDRILVLVTQFGKVGSLIFTTIDSLPSVSRLSLSTSYSDQDSYTPPTTTHVLLGQTNGTTADIYQIYASQIAIAVNTPEDSNDPANTVRGAMPVVVGLALKNGGKDPSGEEERMDRDLLKAVLGMVRECL